MERLIVEGGGPLEGSVRISGAKNAVLPLLAASLLAEGTCRYRGVPRLGDVRTMAELLRRMGVEVRAEGEAIALRADSLRDPRAPGDLVHRMRASILVLGPLLARFGRATVPLPGGCAIGRRPVDIHLEGLRALGAEVEVADGIIRARARRLRGARVRLRLPTVTGTENILMAAALARGETLIENAAREPEVDELIEVLRRMGLEVERSGGNVRVQGSPSLRGVDHRVMPDRIEAGTYLMAAAITGGRVRLLGCRPEHLEAPLHKLREAGVEVRPLGEDALEAIGPPRPRAVDVETSPYPGFPTDLQAQFMALMCLASGVSRITERVFENRFLHVEELRRMGAQIELRGRTALVRGVDRLRGAVLRATDLRASACLVLAALAARGTSQILGLEHLDRGYEDLEGKLRAMGGRLRREPAAITASPGLPAGAGTA